MISTIETEVLIEFDITQLVTEGERYVLKHFKQERRMEPEEVELVGDIKVALKREAEDIATYTAVFIALDYIELPMVSNYTQIKQMCGGTYCVENIEGTPFDYKILGISVTGAVYRILRMAARGRVHIYGLSDKEFYDRMSKTREKYNKTQSRELLKLFKEGLVTTTAKV